MKSIIENSILTNLADRGFPIYLRGYQNKGFCEADIFAISNAGFMYEFEIKVSRADFIADFKKIHKHDSLKKRDAQRTYNKWKRGKITDEKYSLITIPNRFYYTVPSELITKDEVPEYAGLICISPEGQFTEAKPAPLLHQYKANDIIYKNVATILSQRNVWGCAYRVYKFKKNRFD